MTRPLVWTSEANEDLLEARAWYDNIRPEFGARFAFARSVRCNFPVVYRNRRRAGVRRFPYGIFFEFQERRIVVIACFRGRRNPRRWQSR